jgi:hypothetical protein
VIDAGGLDAFVREAARMEVPLVETMTRPAWHHPMWFLLGITLVAAEWGIRRWKGAA